MVDAMTAKEMVRAKNNKRVKEYADFVIKGCESENFTVADMIDLARILPDKISEAIISQEERTSFGSFFLTEKGV